MKGRVILAVFLMFWMTGMISCARKFHFNDYRGYYPDQDYKEHHYSSMNKRAKDRHKHPVKPVNRYGIAPPPPAPPEAPPPPPPPPPAPNTPIPDAIPTPGSEPAPTTPTTPPPTDTTKLFFQFGF